MNNPKLRNIEIIPTVISGQKVLCLRDPSHYTDKMVFISPEALFFLHFFDGNHSIIDIQTAYAKQFGDIIFSATIEKFISELDENLMLESERFASHKEKVEKEFRISPIREAAFKGLSYPANDKELRILLSNFFHPQYKDNIIDLESIRKALAFASTANNEKEESKQQVMQQNFCREGFQSNNDRREPNLKLKGIIAPHIDIQRGGECFAYAYRAIKEFPDFDIFIILGTVHTISSNLFIATYKDFATPFGALKMDKEFIDILKSKYECNLFKDEFIHKSEHSIEFQTVFLKHIYDDNREISIVPILCSSFHEMIFSKTNPIDVEIVRKFIEALKNTIEIYGKKVCFIAGADLAHVGIKFGDSEPPDPYQLGKIEREDIEMLKYVASLDSKGFFESISKDNNKRRICGFAPMYILLNTIDADNGVLLNYEQAVEVDTGSVVTFASMGFYKEE